jgi:hypothetical protein
MDEQRLYQPVPRGLEIKIGDKLAQLRARMRRPGRRQSPAWTRNRLRQATQGLSQADRRLKTWCLRVVPEPACGAQVCTLLVRRLLMRRH